MINKFLFTILCGLFIISTTPGFSAGASPSTPKSGSQIGIVVNKDVITRQDIYDRAMLILLTSGLPNNPETLEIVKDQVKKSLIDEKIQIQAAKEQKIIVSDAEIQEALKRVAGDNNMTVAQMTETFKKQNVPIKTLEERLRAQICWMRTIRDAFGSMIHINESDIIKTLEKITQNRNKDQYDLAEIFLRVENPSQEAAIKKEVDKIHAQLKEGAHFQVMAQQFSQATSSAQGGHIGWMVKGQMDQAIESAVEKLTALGQFSEPIRTPMGYKIIMLRDFKKSGTPAYGQTQVTFRQVQIPYHDSLSGEDYQRIETHVQEMKKISNCDKLAAKAKECGYEHDLISKQYRELPTGFQKLFHAASVGQCLEPVSTKDHIIVSMVCQKSAPEEKLPTHDEVRQQLEQEKMNKIATREFNKIKSVSYIVDGTETSKAEKSASKSELSKKAAAVGG